MSNLIHIISIIASVISIIVSVLLYFGITRYIKLYMSKSTNSYIEKYKNLPFKSDKRTIIVLSIENETDINNIVPTINSLLDQTVRVNQIFLVLPCYTSCNVPENLTQVLTIIKPGKQYNKYHDIVTILQREKEKDTIIIKVSKRIIYGKEFIEDLILNTESTPNSIIKDESNSFIVLTPELIILDDNLEFKNFIDEIKNISYSENYKY